MKIENILNFAPDILINFMKKYTGTIFILLDKNFQIIDCNEAFLHFYNLENVPEEESIYDYLGKEGEDKIITSFPDSKEPVNFKLSLKGSSEATYITKCYMFLIENYYLMFLEIHTLTQTEIVEKMSVLNEELTNMTRELSKKNAELKKANDKINTLLRTDPLTGIYNRRFFMEELDRAFSLLKRHKIDYSIIMADLDEFKKVNDDWGHGTGDRILMYFSELLQDENRKEDIPARIGGEEFVILLPKTTIHEAVNIAERLRVELENKVIEPLPFPLTCSFGVAQINENDSVDSILARADRALYKAKNKGRNRVEKEEMKNRYNN